MSGRFVTRKRSRKCRVCRAPIAQPPTGRPRRFCSDVCRQRACRAARKRAALFSTLSTENEWYTPAVYIDAARAVLGGIDLDPASSVLANETVAAARVYTAQDDGLAQRWEGRVWLNPPYGRLAGLFVAKLIGHYRGGDVTAAVVLVNAHCTDTAWFQPLWRHALCFTDHRIDFESAGRDKTSTSTHGSVFGYLGPDRDRFAAEFARFGPVTGGVAR